MAQARITDEIQQFISPVQIGALTFRDGSNLLGMANLPIGLDGFVEGSTNGSGWATVAYIPSINATGTILFPATGPLWLYRLRFPWIWSWR